MNYSDFRFLEVQHAAKGVLVITISTLFVLTPVPIPPAVVLSGSALAAFAGFRRRA